MTLDSYSIEVISKFKQALADKESILDGLHPKVVEYDGETHLVLTNEVIEKSTRENKRKWSDYYNSNKRKKIDQEESEEEISESESEIDENPLKDLKLAEILTPLSHPLEIISHPAILKIFKSNTYNKLSKELIDLIEIEQNNLNWLNKLLQVLNGEDWFYLLEDQLGLNQYDHGLTDEKIDEIDPNKRITRNDDSSTDSNSQDPFFALPKTLKTYESHQNQSIDDENDDLSNIKEDLINYLQVGIQRQHEYIKTLSQIRNGLVKVDRYRQDLFKWGKEMHDKKSS
ncbi:hypothetical protein HYPBUDRAFT_167274 [Hyphopichia burtonii NRRL Y-1933]|uniref:Transcriptional regulatory protein RXT2 N-terminal domain-containing protein n=1 Tax=Hyphopichia burtonii NRRL Y-1933 TaxID=984485 RepID=A0A1E4RGD5_9ASCO|nr:hypothetical protein HYPBUDRAFT_167274 [Hyphopichia burtonii NRRL Y-1933]ODV66276.1 hypothetical protein HYPBUDRAFT_167274 [Hyphopichia burtonii NRRL Y-1933]